MSESPALVRVRVLQTKLTKPPLPDGMVERPRLLARFDPHARVVLVVAPPGFGKTTLVAQWAESAPDPLAWISVDLLDESPESFWCHVIEAVRSVVPDVDDEPGRALAENPASQLFLNILIAQLERFEGRAVVVLDSWSDQAVRSVAEGLGLLAERVGDRLQFVLTTRVDPPLPLVRWRTQGWLAEIRERDLRFSDQEALGVASTFRNLGLADDVYLRVNRRADGWPIAFHLALVSAQQAADPEVGLRSLASSDRELSDFVVAEILDHLPVDEREVVLDLSVVEWFDPDAAVELAGPRAGAALVELRRRRLLITDVPGRSHGMRFHPLFRELLEAELRWRDPTRHHAVHRRAAAMWRRRGDVPAAYRHLVAGGELTAHDLVVGDVLERVDRGDHEGLRLLQLDHPDVAAVDDADLAIDMAIASFFARAGAAATRWAERADDLIALAASNDEHAVATRLRVHSLWAILDLMEGRTSDADGHIALEGSVAWPTGLRITADAVTALASGRFSTLRAIVADVSDARWASPFLGHGPRFEEGLRALPLDELHPVVARLLAPAGGVPDATAPLVEHLTSRELTILELLPTHLSYAQIAERLYLSVNTVKSNLKAVYRKLGVGTRSDAVLAGRAAGLI